jgi:putative membrane-bound dehydrogenase-like protein
MATHSCFSEFQIITRPVYDLKFMNALRAALCLLLLVSPPRGRAADPKPTGPNSPLTPEQAIATFRVEPGVRVEIAASEPATADPVAIAFDERGRMYVVENRGYPTGPGSNAPPAGVIALLEDVRGDGHFTRRTVFADGLTFPNGILCWKGGVFVTCAPDIFYLKDTDGDGKADDRKVVLTGFSTGSTTQLRVSHPTLGLDNWIYLTSGLIGGKVSSPEFPDRPVVEFTKSDSRFNPETFEFQTVAGQGQYGLTFDDFGRKFICDNRHPLWQVVLQPRYLKRNQYLAFSDVIQEVSPSGDAARVFPISADTTTASFMPSLMSAPHAGTFTSACGSLIYRGNALPDGHYGNAFICEPAQNLVQRQIVAPNGATFRSQLAYQGRDFLASPDGWFRPVYAASGPDGALYICDMYRKTIDHPQYLPEAVRNVTDFDSGKGMGRIYRLVNSSSKAGAPRRSFDLSKADPKELCRLLENPNSWQRDAARRLLLERKDKRAIAPLHAIIKDSKSPEARAAALWTLDSCSALEDAQIRAALADKHPGVREQALQLAENRRAHSEGWFAPVAALADDPDPRVRFQCALVLGEFTEPQAVAALSKIAARDAGDRWTRAAALSSAGRDPVGFFEKLLASPNVDSDGFPELAGELSRVLSASQPIEKLVSILSGITASRDNRGFRWQIAALTGFYEGLRGRNTKSGSPSLRDQLFANQGPDAAKAREGTDRLFKHAGEIASNSQAPSPDRVAAIQLLGNADYAVAGQSLLQLINLQQPAEVQTAAVRALGRMPEPAVGAALVERGRWRSYTPAVTEAVVAAMLSQPRFIPNLLNAIEAGVVQPWALNPARRTQLTKNRDAAISQRAEALFKNMQGGDRMKVYEEYKPILAMPVDAKNGHTVFTRTCASCHVFAGEGAIVGPDLTGVRNQPAEALLLHILVPDAEIVPGFASYDVETRDGRSVSGLLASETPTSVTLRRALAEQETILRSNIASMSSSSLSLMPQELEKTMTRQDLADLIGFLKKGGL